MPRSFLGSIVCKQKSFSFSIVWVRAFGLRLIVGFYKSKQNFTMTTMISKHSQLYSTAIFVFNSSAIALAWLFAYLLRFEFELFSPASTLPAENMYVYALLPVWLIFYINSINKNSYTGRVVILFYYVFNKYKYTYLLTFILLMFMYFISSLKI